MDDRTTSPAANVEQAVGDALGCEEQHVPFASQVRIAFHCVRKRLADVDNLSGKAVIDGLVEAGILADDSAEQVAEVTYRQTKGKTEKTIITIELVNK
jgi:Holliday junction resolvase RusA-like endonuclease